MNFYSFIIILGIFLSFAFAIIIFLRNKKSEVNIIFSLLCILISFCFYVSYMISEATSGEEVYTLLKIVALRNFVFPLSLHFFLVFTNRKRLLKSLWTYVFLYLIPLLIIVSTNASQLFNVYKHNGTLSWIFELKDVPAAMLIGSWIMLLILVIHYYAIRHLIKVRDPDQKKQALLILIGFFVSLFTPVITDVVLPLFSIGVPHVGAVSFILGYVLIGIAVWRYNLFSASPESAADEIITSVSDAVVLTKKYGSITFCNPAAEKLTGYKKDELINKSINELFNLPIIDDLYLIDENNIPKELISSSGKKIPVMVSHTLLQITYKQVNGHAFIFHEITELKDLIDKVAEREARYKNIFENIQSVYFELEPDGTITEVSPSVANLTSYERKDIIGQNILLFFPNRTTWENLNSIINTDHKVANFEAELIDANGLKHYCIINAMSIFEEGHLHKIVGSITNIDELKKAEILILESEKRYRLVTENSTDFVAQFNEAGHFIYISPSFRNYGHQPEDFINTDGNDLVHPDDLAQLQIKIRDSQATGILGLFEFRMRHADGHYIWVETQGNWAKSEDERFLICNTRNISARKALEVQQKESEEKFRLLFEKSPDGILLVKDLFTPISANSALLEIFGYESIDEFLKSPVIAHVLPEYQVKMLERHRLMKIGVPVSNRFEIKIVRKDGRPRHVEYFEHEMLIHGQPYIQFIMRDITEKIHADQQLIESEQKYSLLVENSPDDIFLFDESYRYIMVNAQAAQNMGMHKNELIGKSMFDVFPRQIAERQVNSIKKVFNSGNMSEHIKTFTITAKGERWYSTVLVPVKNAQDKVISVIGIGRDITEVEKAELKIRKNEEMYRLFLENFQGIALRMRMNNTFEFLYGEVFNITGFTIDDFYKGIPKLRNIIHPEDRYQVLKALSMLRKIPSSKITTECRILHQDGKTHYLRVFMQNLLDDKGNPAFIQAALFDKTDIYELQNKIINVIIETEERERVRFAEDLHDELGPLLSSIRIYINLIQTKAPEQEKERRDLIEFAKSLLDDAVQQTRNISYNIMPEILGQYGLIPSVKSFCGKIDKTFKTKVTIKTENFSDDERFDNKAELTIYRVLKELINNSLKHSDAEDITIRFFKTEGKRTIEYMDNGKGFNYDEKFRAGVTLGLRNIQHRIESINGNVHFTTGQGLGLKVLIQW